jgi:hypothetical protein
MNKILKLKPLLLLIALCLGINITFAQVAGDFESKQDGPFNSFSTWNVIANDGTTRNPSTVAVPGTGKNVYIKNLVTLTAAASMANLTITSTGSLTATSVFNLNIGVGLGAATSSIIQNDGILGDPAQVNDKINVVVQNISTGSNSTIFTLSGTNPSYIASLRPITNASVTSPSIKTQVMNINQNLFVSGSGVSFSAIPATNTTSAANEDYTINVAVGKTVLMTSLSASFNNTVAPAVVSGGATGTYTYNIFGTIDCSTSTSNIGIVPMPNNVNSLVTLNIKQGGRFFSGSALQLNNTSSPLNNPGKVILNVDGEADLTKITTPNNGNTAAFWNLSSTGVVRRTVIGATTPSAFTFPVGTSTGYSPISIKNTGTTGVFSIKLSNNFTSAALPDANNSVTQKWIITAENAGPIISELVLGWETPFEGSAFAANRSTSQVSYLDGTTWKSITNSTTTAPTSQTQMVGTILPSTWNATLAPTTGTIPTSASSVSFAVVAQSTLPLKLINFNAKLTEGLSNKKVNLNWATSDEVNTKKFIIERKIGATDFIEIGEIAAKNSGGNHTYAYIDNNPANGTAYYRLKMVDQDGLFSFSDVKAVDNKSEITLQIYPNPTTDKLTVNHPLANAGASMSIFSLNGSKILSTVVEPGSLHAELNVANLKAGTYILKFNNNNNSRTLKFIKQ